MTPGRGTGVFVGALEIGITRLQDLEFLKCTDFDDSCCWSTSFGPMFPVRNASGADLGGKIVQGWGTNEDTDVARVCVAPILCSVERSYIILTEPVDIV